MIINLKDGKYYFVTPPPLSKKVGHIALHMSVYQSVGRSVCQLDLVQLITHKRFAPTSFKLGT